MYSTNTYNTQDKYTTHYVTLSQVLMTEYIKPAIHYPKEHQQLQASQNKERKTTGFNLE
jgi:hypothetical protein